MAPRPALPTLLIVIDGWGEGPPSPHNAIRRSGAPVMTRLAKEFASTLLDASGPSVGLPEGQMGNSEVGHLNIGAGRVVDQDIMRISKACRDGRIGHVPAIRDAFERCNKGNNTLHLLGLLGPGGVHSHEEHLFGLLRAAKEANVNRVLVHHVLDGRDSPPQSALGFAEHAQRVIDSCPNARVATVSGRYYTMDRDKRWERTEKAYRMLTASEGHAAASAKEAIEKAYQRGETDEFVTPTIIGRPPAMSDGDAVIVYNFRPDRVRQIVRALVDPAFDGFPTKRLNVGVVSMTLYDQKFEALGVRVAFPPDHPRQTLGEAYAGLGLRQLRVAETEKYAHVTYFFSGGREDPFPLEERSLVPSPKVATYDLQPQMSAREITDVVASKMMTKEFDLIVMNYANPDMVGHTGKLEPTIAACKVVDECIGRLVEAAKKADYLVAITADHGNAEVMVDEEGRPLTAHTTNPVPFILAHPRFAGRRLAAGGRLSDVAPTLLAALGLDKPAVMTGRSLLLPVSRP